MGEFGLSQPVPRTEDPKFLKGFARYVDDVTLHQNSFGYVLRSPHAHAEIKAIDTVAAAKAPGVLLILTAQDYLDEGLGQLPYNAPGVPGWNQESVFNPGRIPLAVDRVRYVGDGVAYIVADSIANAKDAAELIDVDYAPIASVVETSHALDDGSPI